MVPAGITFIACVTISFAGGWLQMGDRQGTERDRAGQAGTTAVRGQGRWPQERLIDSFLRVCAVGRIQRIGW